MTETVSAKVRDFIAESVLPKWPGVGIVCGLITFAAITLHDPPPPVVSEVKVGFWALALAYLLHWIGSAWDDLIFDPLFGPERGAARLWGGLERARTEAAKALGGGVKGLYETMTLLFESHKKWPSQQIEWSKVARTFVFPLAILPWLLPLSGYSMAGLQPPKWLGLLAAVVALYFYLALRISHINAACALATEAEKAHWSAEEPKGARMFSIGGKVLTQAGLVKVPAEPGIGTILLRWLWVAVKVLVGAALVAFPWQG